MSKSPSSGYQRKLIWLGAIVLLATLPTAWWFVGFVSSIGDRLETERILALARTVTATLETEPIKALKGDRSDIGTPDYIAIQRGLRRARDVNPDFRFVYLMRPSAEKAGYMSFMVDAESSVSEDYSAPGDIYDGPSEEAWKAWNTGKGLVEPVQEDRWGNWTTAFAPVYDSDGTLLAILGMDVRADEWLATLARYRIFSLSIAALVVLLEIAFLIGLLLQQANQRRLAALNVELSEQLSALEKAQAGLRQADLVVKHTGEAIVVLDPEMRVISVNPGFTKIIGLESEAIAGKVLSIFEDNDNALLQISNHLQQLPHWDGTLWAFRASGERFPLEASVDLVHDNQGRVYRHVMVFRDVTIQKRLEDRLRELSSTDGLTLLANRRRFDEVLNQTWHQAMRDAQPVSLLMIDIDHFKPYNDLYGHPQGDRCLQQVAAALASAVPDENAFVARYGGEEFAVILPGYNKAAAAAAAEVLRNSVEQLDIPHERSESGRVTISVGSSTSKPPQSIGFEELLSHADQALYQAKKRGRNSVASEA